MRYHKVVDGFRTVDYRHQCACILVMAVVIVTTAAEDINTVQDIGIWGGKG